MKEMMKHKDYYGSIHYDESEPVFYGKLEFIKSLISYEADTAMGIRSAFEEAVDDYLQMCEDENLDVEKPFKGTFNVRVGERLHQQAVDHAASQGLSLNDYVRMSIEHQLQQDNQSSP